MKDLYNASITSIGTKRLILLSAPAFAYAFFSWLEICSLKFNMLSSFTPNILKVGNLVTPEPFKNKSKCEWNSLLSNWLIGTKSRTVLFRVSICKWNLLFPNWQFRTFFAGFYQWMEHIVSRVAILEQISDHFVTHSYFILKLYCLFFLNEANNRMLTDLLGQAWLHSTIMTFAQWWWKQGSKGMSSFIIGSLVMVYI